MKDIKSIIAEYLQGRTPEGERGLVQRLADGLMDNELKKEMLADWEAAETTEKLNLEHILQKVHYEINMRNTSQKRISRIIRMTTQWAAAILLPLLLATTLYIVRLHKDISHIENTWTTLVSPANSRVEFTLPDGSHGWLNKGSSLTYPIKFGHERRVKLEGEAYFDVQKNPRKPFFVEVQDMNVKVTGTTFNVMSYKEFPVTEVILETGLVKLIGITNPFNVEMTPDTKVTYNRDMRKLTQGALNARNYTSWTEGKLVFRDVDLEEIARRLSIWYNVDVEITDSTLRHLTYHATFEDESIEEVLYLLKLSSPIKYKIINRQMSTGDTYTRKKIIFSSNK
jgi:transmembrane sensor